MNPLDEVLTLSEAAQLWQMDSSTLRNVLLGNRKKCFLEGEFRKSADTWLILKSAMIRLYGEPL